MNIYFAGSIRGGRADAQTYHRIVEHIKALGHRVLTEHVGDLNLKESRGDKAIYEQDTGWLRESDMLIGECTTPSLGVGYELAYAERFGKPCHLFYNKQKCDLSAMLTGNPYFHIHPYSTDAELMEQLDEVLQPSTFSYNITLESQQLLILEKNAN